MNTESYRYYIDKALKPGSSLYYTVRFAPHNSRIDLSNLIAFSSEIRAVLNNIQSPELARIKLAWWRTELQQDNPQHPITQALKPLLQQKTELIPLCNQLINAVEMDLELTRYPGFRELELYCNRRVGALTEAMSVILGFKKTETRIFAKKIGLAIALIEMLQHQKKDAKMGRIYIPIDEIEIHQLSTNDLIQATQLEKLQTLFQSQATRARDIATQALSHLNDADKITQRPLLIWMNLSFALLTEIERAGWITPSPITLTPIRKLWIAWRTR